jgi:hypothetical protein
MSWLDRLFGRGGDIYDVDDDVFGDDDPDYTDVDHEVGGIYDETALGDVLIGTEGCEAGLGGSEALDEDDDEDDPWADEDFAF